MSDLNHCIGLAFPCSALSSPIFFPVRVTSTEGQLNGFQNSLNSAASCEPGTNAVGPLEAGPQVIFARSKPLSSRSRATGTVVGQRKKKTVQTGPT
uniref:Uncharacterized protein n=1 Tax=Sphenodon punctatus TaxID=8508 RepID=A0A8D0HE34_SPHPU